MFSRLFDHIDAAFTALGTSDTYADRERGVLIFRRLTPEQMGVLLSTPLPLLVDVVEVAPAGSDAVANTLASAALDVPPWVAMEPAVTIPGAQIVPGADGPQAGDSGVGAGPGVTVPGDPVTPAMARAPKGKR